MRKRPDSCASPLEGLHQMHKGSKNNSQKRFIPLSFVTTLFDYFEQHGILPGSPLVTVLCPVCHDSTNFAFWDSVAFSRK